MHTPRFFSSPHVSLEVTWKQPFKDATSKKKNIRSGPVPKATLPTRHPFPAFKLQCKQMHCRGIACSINMFPPHTSGTRLTDSWLWRATWQWRLTASITNEPTVWSKGLRGMQQRINTNCMPLLHTHHTLVLLTWYRGYKHQLLLLSRNSSEPVIGITDLNTLLVKFHPLLSASAGSNQSGYLTASSDSSKRQPASLATCTVFGHALVSLLPSGGKYWKL